MGIHVYGFRVAEPQHDGTPHWHLLLFMPPKDVKQVGSIIRDYAMREDGVGLDGDIDGGEPESAAERVRTWAQHLGHTSVSATWRAACERVAELRRLDGLGSERRITRALGGGR